VHLSSALADPRQQIVKGRGLPNSLFEAFQYLEGLLVHLQAVVETAEKEAGEQIAPGIRNQPVECLDGTQRVLALDEMVFQALQKHRATGRLEPLPPVRKCLVVVARDQCRLAPHDKGRNKARLLLENPVEDAPSLFHFVGLQMRDPLLVGESQSDTLFTL
jgi:hypothetical protein